MKKGWKIFWIACGVTACIGLMLCLAGLILGATLRATVGIMNFGYDDEYISWDDDHHVDASESVSSGEASSASDSTSREVEAGQILESFDGIKELDLEIGEGEIQVYTHDGSDVEIWTESMTERLIEKLRVYQEGTELKIEGADDEVWARYTQEECGIIHIGLPKNSQLQEISLTLGAGILNIEELQAGSLDLEVGAGQATGHDIKVREFDLECGAGQAVIAAEVSKDVNVECGVGEVDLTLSGSQQDYNTEVECGIGEILIGADKYSGLGNSQTVHNGGGRELEVSCGMGKVTIAFAE